MKSLEKWQIISFISRAVAMSFGIVQSFIILRILSVGEWGIIQLVVSIGSALGIYQHLGLASASNREIAASEKKTDVFKIFVTSVSVRYLVTIPLSIGLFLASPKIAQTYGFPEMLNPLRIFAGIIFLQGIQAILNAVISGTKRFKELFIFQAVIALASVIIYVPLVYKYKIMGFFYANFIHEFLKSVTLLIVAFKPYMEKLTLPTKKEFITIFRDLFSLGMSIYIVKILVINWEKAGANLLGFVKDAEILGIYSFALLYAKKLMHVSDAITDVNLPVFSEKYVKNVKEFKSMFAQNFNRVYAMILFFAMSAVYWAYELITVLIGSDKYNDALPLLPPLVFAFIFFSLINIVKSSLAIPAKLVKEMILGFVIMFVSTLGIYMFGRELLAPTQAMSLGMLVGSFLGFGYLTFLLQRKLKFRFIDKTHVLLLVQAMVISYMGHVQSFYVKLAAYLVFIGFYMWSLLIAKYTSVNEIKTAVVKSTEFVKRKKK
ncbi:oligosaccharide flippase family protein [Patescibacteria group bacterium]